MGSELANLLTLLTMDNADFLAGVGDSLKETESFVDRLGSVGGNILMGGLAVAGTAIVGIGAAAWEAGDTIDTAMDLIQTSTGATGDELAALGKDFSAVFTSVPTDAENAAEAISILNQRLDLTGPALQDTSEALLEMTRLTEGDLLTNGEKFTRMVGDWGLELDNLPSYLDTAFVASQQTGIGIDRLMQLMVQFGAPMRQFGFGFEESAAMLSKWEKEGVNTEIVMSSLRVAAGKFAREGVDLTEGFWDTVDAIKNASSESEGLAIAMDIFGARSGPDMAAAIRENRFELGNLVDELANSDGAIMSTSDELIGFIEKWDMFKNKITTILAPIGQTAEVALTGVMDQIGAVFERPEVQAGITQFAGWATQLVTTFATYIPMAIDYLFQFVDFLQQNHGVVVGILAGLGSAVVTFAVTSIAAMGPISPVLLAVVAVMAAVGAAAYLIYEAWTNNWGGIRDTLTGVWASLQPTFDALKQWLSVAIPVALQFLSDLWNNTLLPALQAVWAFLNEYVFPILAAVADLVGAYLGVVFKALAGTLQNVVIPALQAIWRWIDKNVLPIIRDLSNWLRDKLGPAFKWVGEKIGDLVDWLHEMADMLRNIELPDWMTPGSPTPWEMGLWGVQDALESLSSTSLPRFEAAVALNPSPVGVGAVDITPRSASFDGGGGGRGSGDDDPLMREIYRMLRQQPQTLANAVRDAIEKRTRE